MIAPFVVSRARPAGSAPLVTAKLVAAGFAERATPLKATPAVPAMTGELTMTGALAEGATEMTKIELGPVPTVFVADTETWNVPNAVGVPEINPVAEASVTPAGRLVAV